MSSTVKEINIPVWNTSGNGWAVSNQGWCKITVTRNYGDTYATVTPYWSYRSPGGAYAAVDCYITVDGSSRYSATFGASTHSAGTWYYVSGSSFKVNVGDGAGSLNISVYMYFNDGTSGRQSSVQSASFAYGTRGETIPSFSKSRVTIGENVSITMEPYSSDFSHKLYYSLNNKDLVHIDDFAKGKATTIWTLPESLAESITTSTEGTVYIVCKTYNGNIQVGGDKSVGLTAVIPDAYVPSISDVTITEITAGLADKFKCFVQHKSALKIKTNCSGVSGSSINSCSVLFNGNTYQGTNVSTGVIDVSGELTVSITVRDSRGRSASSTKVVQVYPYSSPDLLGCKAYRVNEAQELTDDGENILFKFAYRVSPVNNKNTATFEIQQYDDSSNSWKKLIDYPDYEKGSYDATLSDPYANCAKYSPATVYDKNKSFKFRLVVSDYFTTYALVIEVPVSYTLIEFGPNGHSMSFGGPCTNKEDQIDVHMDVEFNGIVNFTNNIYSYGQFYDKRIWDEIYPVGTVILTTNTKDIMTWFPPYSLSGSWQKIGTTNMFGKAIFAYERIY